MDSSSQKEERKNKITEVITFPVPIDIGEIKENIIITNNNLSQHSIEKIINQAIKFHLEGNISEATKYYQQIINLGFKDQRVFSNYGVILQNLDKLKDAELFTRKAIKINPKYANAHYNLGNILRNLGKLKEAEISTRKAIALNPKYANAYSNLGLILKDLGQLKEAEVSTRKAIKINPDFITAHSNLGSILRDLGKFKEAEISTRKAIALNPKYANAYSNLGLILKDLGQLKEAEVSTRKAIKINPDFITAHSNLGSILRDLGKFKEAEISTRKAIKLNPKYANAHYNLGGILIDLGELEEAEISTRKAIELNPNFVDAHHNLGNILNNLGKLYESEISTRKAIELNPDYAKAYYSLSLLKSSDNDMRWVNKLFSESILNNKSKEEKVTIYYARANILHKKQNYKESSRYLRLANNLKLSLKPSKPSIIFNKSKLLLIESEKKDINQKENSQSPTSIFIVGMFRSGSTLLESILSMNNSVVDLGETKILEESFLESKEIDQRIKFAEIYWNKIKDLNKESNISTNKNLHNYQYTGIIAKQIPNAKIIHCFRNPLDNILSIYRAHFTIGNEYSSSIVDCTGIYLDQEEIMTEYKNRFRSKIYDLNYDTLVTNPNKEIKSLISWLGWKWKDSYLEPHRNPRSVFTASSVQVRFPINSKSVGGWRNYKDMLKPAIEILTQTNKYQDITS